MNITTDDLTELIKRQDSYCTCAFDVVRYDHSNACPVTLISELRAAVEIVQTAQGILTALNIGNVESESPLHLKLREKMIVYRTPRRDRARADKPAWPA